MKGKSDFYIRLRQLVDNWLLELFPELFYYDLECVSDNLYSLEISFVRGFIRCNYYVTMIDGQLTFLDANYAQYEVSENEFWGVFSKTEFEKDRLDEALYFLFPDRRPEKENE